MWIKLLISFFLVNQVHSGIFSEPMTVAEEEELTKLIKEACPRNSEINKLSEDLRSYGINETNLTDLFTPSMTRILSVELRGHMKKIDPFGYWTNYTKPNNQEVEEASTIERYYILKERQTLSLSYDQTRFSEKDMKFVVSALDKRFPRIRSTYKNHLNEIRHRQDAPITIDRDEVDMMFKEMEDILSKFEKNFFQIQGKQNICNLIKVLSVSFGSSKNSGEVSKEIETIKS